MNWKTILSSVRKLPIKRILLVVVLLYIAALVVPYIPHKKVSETFQEHFHTRQLFPSLPVLHLVKLFAADLLDVFQFHRKSVQGNFPFPDQTDSVPAAAYRCTAAFFRHYGRTLCRTDRRPSVLCSRS